MQGPLYLFLAHTIMVPCPAVNCYIYSSGHRSNPRYHWAEIVIYLDLPRLNNATKVKARLSTSLHRNTFLCNDGCYQLRWSDIETGVINSLQSRRRNHDDCLFLLSAGIRV